MIHHQLSNAATLAKNVCQKTLYLLRDITYEWTLASNIMELAEGGEKVREVRRGLRFSGEGPVLAEGVELILYLEDSLCSLMSHSMN